MIVAVEDARMDAVAVVAVDSHGAMRDAVVAEAERLATRAVGKPLKLSPEQVRTAGEWAFVSAQMQDLHGRPVDYEGTRLAADAREGGVSKRFVALLRREGQGWRVVEQAAGPTGVVWDGWASTHGAPPALFGAGR